MKIAIAAVIAFIAGFFLPSFLPSQSNYSVVIPHLSTQKPIREFSVVNGKIRLSIDHLAPHGGPNIHMYVNEETNYHVEVVFSDGSRIVSAERTIGEGWGIYERIEDNSVEHLVRYK